MPVTVYTFAWTNASDRTSWWPYSDSTLMSGNGSDFSGASTPGCLALDGTLTDAGDIYYPYNRFLPTNWENLGVPSGTSVTSVSGRMRAIQNTDSGYETVIGQITFSDLTTWAYLWDVADMKALITSSWATITMPAIAIPGALSASNTLWRIQFLALGHANMSGGSPFARYTYLFDTLELTITHT